MTENTELRQPANWLNFLAVGGATLAAAFAIVATLLLGEQLNLVLIFGCTAIALTWLTTICDVYGIHAVWRMLMQFALLGVAMYFLYDRGDAYIPQAAMMALGAVLIMNPLSFASEAAENSGQARLVPLLGILNCVYFGYVGLQLPNFGVFQLSMYLGVLSLALLITPLPHSGILLGSLAWAVGAYAWLANASLAMVLAPVMLVVLDVGWTLLRRLITKDGRASMPSRGSFWSKLNAWVLPGLDMVTQRLGANSSPWLAIFWIATGAILSCVAVSMSWMLHLGDNAILVALIIASVGYIFVALLAMALQRRRSAGTSQD